MIIGKKILITGGAGFIGFALVERLIKDNQIVVIDNFHQSHPDEKVVKYYGNDNFYCVKGDVRDMSVLQELLDWKMHDTDIIIHCAAVAGVGIVMEKPLETVEGIFIGTRNMLEIATKMKKLTHFINFSTSEVLGDMAFRPLETASTEVKGTGGHRWCYAASKLAAEHLVRAYEHERDLPAVTVRPFNVFGPGEIRESAVQCFASQAVRDETLQIKGSGVQVRCWCYIDDFVDAILLFLRKKESIGQTFHIGNPASAITVLSLAEKIVHLAKSKSKIVHIPADKNEDVAIRISNITKAKKLLGYDPKIGLDEGLRRAIKWYRRREHGQI